MNDSLTNPTSVVIVPHGLDQQDVEKLERTLSERLLLMFLLLMIFLDGSQYTAYCKASNTRLTSYCAIVRPPSHMLSMHEPLLCLVFMT